MKHNNIDIVVTIEEMVRRFNKQNEEAKTDKLYSISINSKKQPVEGSSTNQKKGGKTIKCLSLYLNDLKTGERLLLYTNSFIPKSPAHLLTTNYKVLLYREMFYNFFAFSAINIENIKRKEQAEKAIQTATKLAMK